ncbi:heme NO-binding domain-containing protein [Sphingomonas sabuli]|uniref:Heme NO-binding domain-containing protein n=1 Tax=Sphingomonas sabuli TaxID=2764186 RepID=A0A7G9L4X9_9SPHN|nr:heme NO-binding domain-containing protein [Sphingomonas sabuli]QNM83678.1 heme NO-binding domain-containing protein [Sphingomonas sabuli]
MKGIVFNLLEDVITQSHGADAWMDLVDAAGVSGIYTSLGSYPDEEVNALVITAADRLGSTPDAVLQSFGRAAMPRLADRYSEFFVGHDSTRSFVLSVNDIIHPEVRKLYSGAGCPHFHFRDDEDGRLLVGYQSPRGLCKLAHGFIEGASDHFGETAEIEHLACMHHGAPSCTLAVRWS